MFTTLNLRWLIDLKEREARQQERIASNTEPQWLRRLLGWCKDFI
jgi:hypothetical protein